MRWIRHLRMILKNPWFRKKGATLVNLTLCYQKMFVPKKLCIINLSIFLQMIREVFAWFSHFISLVAAIRMYYRNLQCRNSTV